MTRTLTGGCRLGRCASALSARRGFTLTEVMFAVVLLGIGFILVAAMFPVAIRQSRTSTEETVASAMARSAISYLEQIANGDNMQVTAELSIETPPHLWQEASANLVNAADPRYAWTFLYRRVRNEDPYAQVMVIILQSRNRPQFDLHNDTIRPALASNPSQLFPASIEPKALKVNVQNGGSSPDRIELLPLGSATTVQPIDPRQAAAEGAHVILTDGTVFRLARPVNRAAGIWELDPSNDFTGTSLSNASAYIIGRGYADTATTVDGAPQFEGTAMDIAVFTGFVRLKK